MSGAALGLVMLALVGDAASQPFRASTGSAHSSGESMPATWSVGSGDGVVLIQGPPTGEPALVERRLVLMGTEAEVRVAARDRAAALAASEAAIRALEAAEARLSTWTETSELALLNRAPAGEPVALSAELAAELAAAEACRRETGGAFDAGVGPLVDAWGLRTGGHLPSPRELAAARLASGGDGLELRDDRTAVRRRPGLRIEEGGFGKGAALDAALAAAAAVPGVEGSWIDLGGQVAYSKAWSKRVGRWRPSPTLRVGEGTRERGVIQWTEVAVAHPADRDRPLIALALDPAAGGSVATSGNSERGITVAGERRSHVLDPRTGEPAPDFGSVTVWARAALRADCLSTGLYVLGPEAALAWAAGRPGLEVVVLRALGATGGAEAGAARPGPVEVLATQGLENRLRVLDAGSVTKISFSLDRPPAAAQNEARNEVEPQSVYQQVEELRRQIEELRRELEALREERGEEADAEAEEARPPGEPAAAAPPAEADRADQPDRLTELERRIEILAAELERLGLGEAAARADESVHGFGPAASKVYRTEEGLSIGGYGEMLYESPDSERDDGSRSGRTDQLDFLRAIVYFGYKFDERFLFNSEIEFEHASTGSGGEASVEFAYLDYLWRPEVNVRAGLLLLPVGFVNELHEPTVFLGAKRPDVERVILPSTWRENGFGLFGEAGPVSWRAYLVNGLEGAGFSAGGLRGGRQKGAQALAEDFAWVGRLDWTPAPGVLLGASAYLGDSGQGLEDPASRVIDLGTTILEGHAEWRWRGLELRGLVARAELDDVARLNQARGLTGAASVGEELSGWYLQAGYDVLARFSSTRQLIPYARLEEVDTQAEVPAGFAANPANDVESLTLGVAFKPIDQVIVKADFQDYDNGAGTGTDQFNVALGYIF